MGLLLLIYNTIKPDTTVRTAAQLATQSSRLLNRTVSLVNFAYGEDLDRASPMLLHQDQGTCFADEQSCDYVHQGTCLADRPLVSYKVDQDQEHEREHHLLYITYSIL